MGPVGSAIKSSCDGLCVHFLAMHRPEAAWISGLPELVLALDAGSVSAQKCVTGTEHGVACWEVWEALHMTSLASL